MLDPQNECTSHKVSLFSAEMFASPSFREPRPPWLFHSLMGDVIGGLRPHQVLEQGFVFEQLNKQGAIRWGAIAPSL